LNVGPTGEGIIPAPSVERLREVGQWMKVNREAIYATTGSPFKPFSWGRCTKKTVDGKTTLYLHVFNWPADGSLTVPGLKAPVESASLLATGEKLSVDSTPEGLHVKVPGVAPDKISSTIVLNCKGSVLQ
jgi:alpha-L-fucosidase